MVRKTPVMPASTHNKLKWKNPTRSLISFHEMSTEKIPRKNVSSNMSKLNPSSANEKLTPKLGIQGSLNRSIHESEESKEFCIHSTILKIKSTTRAVSEIHRENKMLTLETIQARMPPTISIIMKRGRIIFLIYQSQCQ